MYVRYTVHVIESALVDARRLLLPRLRLSTHPSLPQELREGLMSSMRKDVEMREIGAPFAGELSGHMFFADEYYGFDDSFYAAGRILRILSRTGRSLSDLMASIPLYPATEEARIDCPDSEKFDVIRRIRDKALKDYKGLTLDGIRILYPGGWGLIRASNTQPVITTRCEGRDEKTLAFIQCLPR